MTALGLTGTSGGAGDIASLTKVDAGGNTYTGAKAFAMRMMGVHDGNDCATIATDVDKIITASPEVKYSFTTNYKDSDFWDKLSNRTYQTAVGKDNGLDSNPINFPGGALAGSPLLVQIRYGVDDFAAGWSDLKNFVNKTCASASDAMVDTMA